MSEKRCPTCQSSLPQGENKFFPFCSHRCRLLDLGAWASEKYRIPVHNELPASNQPSKGAAEE
ncbi:MAG: DNA gyrase inhibitor YacG [Oligoflexia bacterium]|nr:DNA gyrase inhibitor YacG [Oligoflexia bacterium]